LAGSILPRAGVAISRCTGVDDCGIELAHRLVVEPDSLHHAGSKILDDHVRLRHQVLDPREVRGILEIGCDTLLVAIHRMERNCVAIRGSAGEGQRSTYVADARPLDLDDARAQIGQPHCCDRTSQKLAEVENEDAIEWQSGLGGHAVTASRLTSVGLNHRTDRIDQSCDQSFDQQ
jgi:hypothetical protein